MNFKPLADTGKVDGFALVKKSDVKITQRGAPYLELTLADSEGEINAKFWDYDEKRDGKFEINTLVKVRGIISEYNGHDQMKIDRIRRVEAEDRVNEDDYVPTSSYDPQKMFDELISIANKFNDEDLKNLTLSILKSNREKLLYYPAAVKLHHALKGGLLMHTLSIVRMAQKTCEVYPNVDEDLLLCGCMLHDIGKLTEIESGTLGLANGYSNEGTLIGHLVKGAMTVDETGKSLDISKEKLMLVEHMLLSHHMQPDYGAAVRPMFLEAEILAILDNLDATIYEIDDAVRDVDEYGFSNRQWALDDVRFYNHGRTTGKERTKLF